MCKFTVHLSLDQSRLSYKIGLIGLNSVLLVGAQTRCALLPSVCDLKAVQCSLIPGVMLYEFDPGYNPADAAKTFAGQKLKVQLITVQ